jgi:hypothetical protein
MLQKNITFCGKEAKVACDGNCNKAWGINSRPSNEDKSEWLSDTELDDAPVDPGTYEGGDAKPSDSSQFPNKWCVRECERCSITPYDGNVEDDLKLRDFSNRVKR